MEREKIVKTSVDLFESDINKCKENHINISSKVRKLLRDELERGG